MMNRHKGGAEAMCSLRLIFPFEQMNQENPPEILIGIKDNCVGQNKRDVVMKFDCMLSICFSEKVVDCFLKSGHSHMIPDSAKA